MRQLRYAPNGVKVVEAITVMMLIGPIALNEWMISHGQDGLTTQLSHLAAWVQQFTPYRSMQRPIIGGSDGSPAFTPDPTFNVPWIIFGGMVLVLVILIGSLFSFKNTASGDSATQQQQNRLIVERLLQVLTCLIIVVIAYVQLTTQAVSNWWYG